MFKIAALFLKETQPIGRARFFLSLFVLNIVTGIATKALGKAPTFDFLIYLLTLPVVFILIYARILDIERGMQRKTKLVFLWLVFASLSGIATYCITFYPPAKNDPAILWLLPLLIATVGLHFYILFKRGYSDIEKERKEQERLATIRRYQINDPD